MSYITDLTLPHHRRQSMMQPEALRPTEPTNIGNALGPCLSTRVNDPNQPRQQLPGFKELMSSALGTNPPSSSPNPALGNDTQHRWSAGPVSLANLQSSTTSRSSRIESLSSNPTPPPFHRLFLNVLPTNLLARHAPILPLGASTSPPHPFPPPASSGRSSDIQYTHAANQVPWSAQAIETGNPPQSQVVSASNQGTRGDMAGRLDTSQGLWNAVLASNHSLQCIDQCYIPGESMCYISKDGSTCPTIIDGEPVNTLWGTTKAGKARKRLAQACLNCREKKVKCELGEKSCLGCEKRKRGCYRFASPRSVADGLPRDESRPPAQKSRAELASNTTLAISNMPLGRADCSSQSADNIVVDKLPNRKRRRPAQEAQRNVSDLPPTWSCDESPQSVKRRRPGITVWSLNGNQFERQHKDSRRAESESISHLTLQLGELEPFSWDCDPYFYDPEATMRFLELFFAQSGREVSIMFPRNAFTRWVQQCREKCQQECMVLYAVLALGSLFAKNEFSTFAKTCAERAGQAVSRIDGKFGMAVVQARLLVAEYNHLIGDDSTGWELSGSALRVISAMRLNSEEGCARDLDEDARGNYSFSREQLKECRRRTFWTAFLIDRYHGYRGGLLCAIHVEDIHLRFPGNEQSYEKGRPSDAPLFQCFRSGTVIQLLDPSSTIPSSAAYTIMVAALWTDVTKLIYRKSRQNVGSATSVKSQESLLDDIQDRLSDWRNALPPHLHYSQSRLFAAIQHGYAGSLVAMHALFHISQLKAARNAHHEALPLPTMARRIRVAHSHATQLLEMVRDVRYTKTLGSDMGHDPVNLLSPFLAYGIYVAIDTLSAGGLRVNLGRIIMFMKESIATLHDLAQICTSTKSQARQTSRRMALVEAQAAESFEAAIVMAAPRVTISRGDEDCWRITEPMEKVFTLQQDVSYGTSSEVYFAALREDL